MYFMEKDTVQGVHSMSRQFGLSYTRFSDPAQSKGDSENRQEEMYRRFCERHNLTPLSEVFADRGRSGYKDEHRKKGRLGELIAMAKDGKIEPGTVIVVEAWDRLGRLRPDKQTELVAELLRTGVNIGVCRLDDIFTEEDFGTHKWTTLAVFIQLAYQESKQKAERVADSWKRRRQRARQGNGLLTNRLPAWLETVNDQVRLIPQRHATVRRIFALAAAGQGHTRIVRTLQKEGVPAFGELKVNTGRSRSQFSGKWTRPYVALILNDRRAVGEVQPMKMVGKTPDQQVQEPDGPPIPNYYPAAITEEEFQLARAGQEERRNKDKLGRANGYRQGKYVNLFKGLLTHSRDGQGFLLHNKGKADRPELLLINTTGNGGQADKSYTFPYAVFEEAILHFLEEVDPQDVLPKKAEERSQADLLRAKLANIRSDMEQLKDDLSQSYSKALTAVLRQREEEEERTAAELQEELARSVKPVEKAWQELPSLVDMIRKNPDPDAVRLALRPILRRVVDAFTVLIVPRGSWRLVAVQADFHGGTRRSYLIVHQTAGFRRPGGWAARSFAEARLSTSLDLRHQKTASRLEAALLELPLAPILNRCE
jgi:DNA invertase Pin-like site-specific DNA recombinase